MRYTTRSFLTHLVSSVLPAMLILSTVGSLRSVFVYEHIVLTIWLIIII